MRKLALAVLVVASVAGGLTGCGSSPAKKVTGSGGSGGTKGSAGAGGSPAGSAGAAGGASGDTGTAGAGGAAGDNGTAGGAAGGTAGAGGAAGGAAGDNGAAGAGGTPPPPPPPYCDTHAKQPLPYDIGGDFTSIQTLTHASDTWKQIANPNCDQTVFPPLNPPDAGADGGTDAAPTEGGADGGTDAAPAEGGADGGTDAADDTLTLALNDDASADAPAGDGAADVPVDAPTGGDAADGGVTDGSSDAGDVAKKPSPACFEFTYNPDPCVAANGGDATVAIGACWAGTIFQPTGNTLGLADQGICIGDNAVEVDFEARANVAGQIIKFGSIREGMNQTEFYITLTTAWTKYHTAIPAGEPYNTSSALGGVWNGFSVVGEPQSNVGGSYIFVRNITWSATATP